jgi:hypothetical protein
MTAYLGENKEPCLLVREKSATFTGSEYYLCQIIAYTKQACRLFQNVPRAKFIPATKYFVCVNVVHFMALTGYQTT